MKAWTKPHDLWIKLNTDGSSLENKGKIGTGVMMRDHEGKMLLAYTTPLGNGSNNQADIGVAIYGMTWALELG